MAAVKSCEGDCEQLRRGQRSPEDVARSEVGRAACSWRTELRTAWRKTWGTAQDRHACMWVQPALPISPDPICPCSTAAPAGGPRS